MVSIMILKISQDNPERINEELGNIVKQAPNFFRNTPLVLELDAIRNVEGSFRLQKIVNICKSHGFSVIAIRTIKIKLISMAEDIDLLTIPLSKHSSDGESMNLMKPASKNSKIITTPVRSGQTIYAQHTDLIVTSSVSHGAELVSDGNIHIYGKMQGRALAGGDSNTAARIFCRYFAAELVSIAGTYTVSDDLQKNSLWEKSAQVSLSSTRLNLSPL